MEGTSNGPIPTNPVERQIVSNPPPVIPTQIERTSPLASLANANFIRAKPKLIRRDHQIEFANANFGFEDFVTDLWNYLDEITTSQLNLDNSYISQADFIRMSKTLLVYRVQQVREQRLGQRAAANRIVIPRGYAIPAALAEIFSGVGETYIDSRGCYFVPTLPPVPTPVPDFYTLDPTITLDWTRFCDSLSRNNLHRTVPMPSDLIGTVYWLLDHVQPDANTSSIESKFGEGTPSDGLLALTCNISVDMGGHRDFTYVQSMSVKTTRYIYYSQN